jgi:hypothetical protein
MQEITYLKRTGIHYFADSAHYGTSDQQIWLPRLKELGVNWVTLQAPLERAIPEDFIQELIANDIQPILHFPLPLNNLTDAEALAPMFSAYANWGVRYAVLFDRPNLRAQWPGMGWTQRGLVDRFLDLFIPIAQAALDAGLTPVFPALEPGGDYWDTAFLRAALETMLERGEVHLADHMALGAYVWTGDKSMNWGAGGPERWPATLPYSTPENSQDQRGLRIFDWYNAICNVTLGHTLQTIIVAAGVQREVGQKLDAQNAKRAIKIAELLAQEPQEHGTDSIPANVIACNFWLLSAKPDSNTAGNAWFQTSGKATNIGKEWIDWRLGKKPDEKSVEIAKVSQAVAHSMPVAESTHAIRHYLLLPDGDDWSLDSIKTFLIQHQPTIGYSTEEALRAARVTLAGGLQSFSDELIRNLITAGCQVEALPMATAA